MFRKLPLIGFSYLVQTILLPTPKQIPVLSQNPIMLHLLFVRFASHCSGEKKADDKKKKTSL